MDAKWGLVPSEPLVGFGAPPVVAVVVTADPGDWFDETIESLAGQDYENLSVLVIDNGGTEDPTARIADILPTAFVKRVDADRGFSAATNEALVAVEGAAFYLVLHDDVRLDPDVVTSLVAEAFRSNGGIVGPKLVDWDDPTRLRSVGYSVDPYGFSSSISEPHELDQSQHDTARGLRRVRCLHVGARRPVRHDRGVQRVHPLLRRGHRSLLAGPHGRCDRTTVPECCRGASGAFRAAA